MVIYYKDVVKSLLILCKKTNILLLLFNLLSLIYMLINNCIGSSQIIQVDVRLIEQAILNMQKYIYRATKTYNIKERYKWQKKILLTKEIILSILYDITKIIKKKFIYLIYTIENF